MEQVRHRLCAAPGVRRIYAPRMQIVAYTYDEFGRDGDFKVKLDQVVRQVGKLVGFPCYASPRFGWAALPFVGDCWTDEKTARPLGECKA